MSTTWASCTVTPPEISTVAPGWNPEPVSVTGWCDAPIGRELGLATVMTGLAFTEKQPEHVAVTAPGFVTTTSRTPTVALPPTVTSTASDVAELRTVECTVIPVPENFAFAPTWKPSPVTSTSWCAAPCARAFGCTPVTRKARRPNVHVLNWVVRTVTKASPDPPGTAPRATTHGSGTASVGLVQSPTRVPLRNTCTFAGGVAPSSLASIVNVATYGSAARRGRSGELHLAGEQDEAGGRRSCRLRED